MIGRSVNSGYASSLSESRLKKLLCLFFLAVSIPAAALVWQAYSQLKWEAFHQSRGVAEELTTRMRTQLDTKLQRLESRSFADYSFLVSVGDTKNRYEQRSPLSEFPVVGEIPGTLGYFQIDGAGKFSTPLLSTSLLSQLGASDAVLGMDQLEYQSRVSLINTIVEVLKTNALIKKDTKEDQEDLKSEMSGDDVARIAESADQPSQIAFDNLNSVSERLSPESDVRKQKTTGENVNELQFDSAFQKRSQLKERALESEARLPSSIKNQKSRKEIEDASNTVPTLTVGESELRDADTIKTFENEIDPMTFRLLDSTHFVLFRRIRRNEQNYVQGLLVDKSDFIEQTISQPYNQSVLSTMGNLVAAYNDEILMTRGDRTSASYSRAAGELSGSLLYQSRLSSPFDNIELLYSVNRLPPGPGWQFLVWLVLAFGLVLIGGLYALYRVGLRQIGLVKQQQDFVSAVSHELKTPLTSIRMYGEMLKEGWADEEKKQVYYEFIHDESERLSRLISNVLKLSNMTHSDVQPNLTSCSLAGLVDQLKSKLDSLLMKSDIQLELVSDTSLDRHCVMMDEDSFLQIVINLVDNAVKFSRHTSLQVVTVNARVDSAGHFVVSVRDYGNGIPNDQLGKIFKLFYRSENELTRETVGTGIGLAIVHQLCSAMNGSVDVANRKPGAEFLVSFPAFQCSQDGMPI